MSDTSAGRTPVGVAPYGGSIVVVCDDGTAWIWSVEPIPDTATPHERAQYEMLIMTNAAAVPHTWRQFHTPIPGTTAHRNYSS